MRISVRNLVVLLALAAAAMACAKDEDKTQSSSEAKSPGAQGATPQSDDELNAVLASIDDVEITVREFQDRINHQSPYIRARYTSLEQKKEFLDSLVRFEVLAKEALSRGFDKDADVVRTMKQVMIQKLMKDEFENKLSPDSIPEAEMQAYYEAHKPDYNKPEEVRVSAIILGDKAAADKVAKLALGSEGKTNKGFRDLVSRYSTDKKTKVRGGDLRYFNPEAKEVPEAVKTTAFAMKKTGEVAGPIAAGDGQFYVIKQTGKRKAISKSFAQVKRQIQNRLYREKRTQSQKDFITNLKQKATIKIDEKNLSRVRIDTSKAGDDPHGHGQTGGDQPGAPKSGAGGPKAPNVANP